ncbi:MAG: YifB family Mg chelatase-like AAA ATPase [Spirochaetia bacterium]|nr:YifB family Mg chelatase-like AAA ATPase [Spirochaetia bacterium]MCF7946613.1 YifB family Mg chelatase-like AAA ATPase [Spirochaetia bacterium]MCF7952817.1 YifB family Mg chelatase-like AAA ATPase [Spirochaetales bacterium]
MTILGFINRGFSGDFIEVEVDIRKGIPGFDIIGLPDSAVREARDRVRTAIRNAGLHFPRERVLVNLAPADMKKEGASLDLAIAAGVLHASGAINFGENAKKILVAGELDLSGDVRSVQGVAGAVLQAQKIDIDAAVIPEEDISYVLKNIPNILNISSIKDFPKLSLLYRKGLVEEWKNAMPNSTVQLKGNRREKNTVSPAVSSEVNLLKRVPNQINYEEIIGLDAVKRALTIAAAGGHHVLLFGPPGCGKTISAEVLGELLPNLFPDEIQEVIQIYSAAEKAEEIQQFENKRPPVRMPHHSTTKEMMLGGGKNIRPGEISLAHKGLLIIDEAPEFSRAALQSLREPLEQRRVEFMRNGRWFWFPSHFQLIMNMNPCPCGQLGLVQQACLCKPQDIHRYWKRIGNPLLDRIPIRIPVENSGNNASEKLPLHVNPNKKNQITQVSGENEHGGLPTDVENNTLNEEPELKHNEIVKLKESFTAKKARIESAGKIQRNRFKKYPFNKNEHMPFNQINTYCIMDKRAKELYDNSLEYFEFSVRASHSIIKVARTIADYENSETIQEEHIAESLFYRKYGDGDYYWKNIHA